MEFKINFQLQILNCCEDMVRNVSSNLQSNKYKHMKLNRNSSNYLTFWRGEIADMINRQRLHVRKDGQPVSAKQVFCVVAYAPHTFALAGDA